MDKSLEEKKKIAEAKIKEKKENKNKTEKDDVLLLVKPCNVMGVKYDESNFIYDTGTVSEVMGACEKDILFNVKELEVSIWLIQMKVRATKAGIRECYGYLPANQLNMDLCLDSVQVLNCIPKNGETLSPYTKFTG